MNKFGSNRSATSAAPARAAAAPSTGRQVSPGIKPTHVLKMQGEDGKLVTITGLFESVDKKGETYLSGKDKESGIKYVVYTKTDFPAKA